MNKRFQNKIAVILFVLLNIIISNIYAANITGNSNVNVGDTFTITFEFGTNVGAYDSIDVSYDKNMYEYVSGDSLNETLWWDQTEDSNGITSKSYTFRALNEGSSRIAVVAKGVTSANETMDLIGTLTAEKMITAVKKQTTEQIVPQENNTNTNVTTPNSSVPLNSNNFLKYIQLSEEGLTPNFTRNVTNYSLAVNENVNNIDIIAVAEDSNAKVEITGNSNIVDGDNTIQIKVTAQNGNVKIYNIIVTKTSNIETSNAYLENLIVEDFNLDKEFQSEILEYDLGDISNIITSLNVVAIAKSENAKIEILGAESLKAGGQIIVRVTAEDGVTVREYKLNYNYVNASEEEINRAQLQDYLKEIQNSKNTKEKAIAYLKYLWLAVKKNYLLIIMYILILIEFIQIVILRKRLNRKTDDTPPDNSQNSDNDEFLKVDLPKKEEEKNLDTTVQNFENNKIEPPQITPIEDKPVQTVRHGSLQNRADGIKLVDLDKNEGPQDELTFNIFENLNDDDIKKMLEDEINKE